jgi:hypothetical protein
MGSLLDKPKGRGLGVLLKKSFSAGIFSSSWLAVAPSPKNSFHEKGRMAAAGERIVPILPDDHERKSLREAVEKAWPMWRRKYFGVWK